MKIGILHLGKNTAGEAFELLQSEGGGTKLVTAYQVTKRNTPKDLCANIKSRTDWEYGTIRNIWTEKGESDSRCRKWRKRNFIICTLHQILGSSNNGRKDARKHYAEAGDETIKNEGIKTRRRNVDADKINTSSRYQFLWTRKWTIQLRNRQKWTLVKYLPVAKALDHGVNTTYNRVQFETVATASCVRTSLPRGDITSKQAYHPEETHEIPSFL